VFLIILRGFLASLFLPGGGVRLATWNGRGVCLESVQGRREMGETCCNLAHRVDILLLQEVHGNTAEIVRQLQMWLPHFLIYGTGCGDWYGTDRLASGGCAVITPSGGIGCPSSATLQYPVFTRSAVKHRRGQPTPTEQLSLGLSRESRDGIGTLLTHLKLAWWSWGAKLTDVGAAMQ